jgi:hypothetical protein
MPDDLSPRISRRDLPPRVSRNRNTQAERDAYDRQRFERAISAHITARRSAFDALAGAHQAVAEAYDLDLTGDTRPAATWQMTGRCIGIARAILDLLALGYTAEVIHLGRSLHEATRLLGAIGDPFESPLLRQWLAGKRILPSEARKAEQRFEERHATATATAEKSELGRTGTLTKRLYGELSKGAHHERPAVQEAVAPQLRTMIRGPDHAWQRRAIATSLMMSVLGEAFDWVSTELDRFYGASWYEKNVKPYWARFAALAQEHPLR